MKYKEEGDYIERSDFERKVWKIATIIINVLVIGVGLAALYFAK